MRKQFPFLETVLDLPMDPQGGNEGTQIDELTIKVERADGDLLFRTAQNYGTLGERGVLISVEGPHKGTVSKQGEHLFAFSKDGELINTLAQKRTDFGSPIYAEQIFWTLIQDNWRTGPLFGDIAKLVWVTVNAYYEDTGNSDDRFGKFLERTVSVTIYQPPEEGFLKLEQDSRIEDHLLVTNNVLMQAALHPDKQIAAISARFCELAELFYHSVYTKGMEDALEKAEWKGCSGTFGDVSVKAVWGLHMVGVELSSPNADVEFRISDGSKVMFAGSVYGKLSEIRQLVIDVIIGWQNEEAREAFGPDTSVINFGQALSRALKE